MALNFPSSPTIGQVYTDTTSGFSYEWDGTVWKSYSSFSSSQIKTLDDISSSFDGIQNTFALTSSGSAITPASAQSLIINLGGVIQDPTDDYSVSTSNIIFSTPPTNGLSFSGISLGPAIPVNTIPDGAVTGGSLRISTTAVVGSATTFSEDLVVEGDARVTGIVTATSFYGDGSSLTGISAGASGGGSDEIFYENGQTVTTDYTISTSKNAMSAGPIGIATGITVTIPSGSTWTIV